MKISELPEAPMPSDDAVIAYDFVGDVPRRNMPIGEYLRRHKPVYTHRNGETEPPTEPDRYWFKGTFFGGTDDFDVADQVIVIAADNFGLMAFCPLEYYEDIESFRGQWWGPIVPPWETST